jgi:hypothetical protein
VVLLAGAVALGIVTIADLSGVILNQDEAGAVTPENPAPQEVQDKVPSSWGEGEPTGDGGWKWQDPNNPGNNIRWSPGNPKSEYPNSRGPNVKVNSNGRRLDRNGDPSRARIPSEDSETHIPQDEWLRWGSWNGP